MEPLFLLTGKKFFVPVRLAAFTVLFFRIKILFRFISVIFGFPLKTIYKDLDIVHILAKLFLAKNME